MDPWLSARSRLSRTASGWQRLPRWAQPTLAVGLLAVAPLAPGAALAALLAGGGGLLLASRRRPIGACDDAGIAHVAIDDRGRILEWSPAAERLFGYAPAEVAGRNVAMLMPPPFAEEHDSYLQRYREAPPSERQSRILGAMRQVTSRHRDGGDIPLLLHVTPRRSGGFDGILLRVPAAGPTREPGSTEDLAPKIAWRWLRNLGHEIRTPMAGLQCHAEILVDPLTTAQERQVAAAAILRNSSHLVELVNDLLDHARLAAGQMPIRLAPIELRELLDDAIGLFRSKAGQQGVQLQVAIAADVPARCTTDPMRLRQILANLIGNAVKFTAQGFVRLEVSRVATAEGPRLRCDVCDSGVGIAAEFTAALFQPFQQDHRAQPSGSGTGLGLSICRQLARLLGGDVALVDSVPGVGSRFRAEVQLVTAPAPTAPPPAPASATGSLCGWRILLVDDAEDLRLATRRFLQAAGAEVDDYPDPAAALKALGNAPPLHDLALLDLMMPGMSGYELAEALRQRAFRGPLVALSADGGADLERRCAAAGFARCLQKPIRRQDLVAALLATLAAQPSAG